MGVVEFQAIMDRRRKRGFTVEEAMQFLNYLKVEKPLFPLLISVILLGWVIERWVFSFSNWVPLVVVVWATIQVSSWPSLNPDCLGDFSNIRCLMHI